jgi:hypothetical protein
VADASLHRAERKRLERQAAGGSPERVYDPDTKYTTMWAICKWAGVQPGTLSRWVNSWRLELGNPSIVRRGKGPGPTTGFSIPVAYTLVAKGWTMTKDPEAREAMLSVLPADPQPWVVTVGKVGYTCYTAEEASQEVTRILTGKGIPESVQVFHVGEVPKLN